jgi:hypothetical protein
VAVEDLVTLHHKVADLVVLVAALTIIIQRLLELEIGKLEHQIQHRSKDILVVVLMVLHYMELVVEVVLVVLVTQVVQLMMELVVLEQRLLSLELQLIMLAVELVVVMVMELLVDKVAGEHRNHQPIHLDFLEH